MVSCFIRKAGDPDEQQRREIDFEGYGVSPYSGLPGRDEMPAIPAGKMPQGWLGDKGRSVPPGAFQHPIRYPYGGREGVPLQGLYRLRQRESGGAALLPSEHGRSISVPV